MTKHEPEVRLAKGRAYAASNNDIAANYDTKTIYKAMELSEQAHEVHRLPYLAGLNQLKQFPPDRFEWICDEASISIKLRDKQTAIVADWPHWAG